MALVSDENQFTLTFNNFLVATDLLTHDSQFEPTRRPLENVDAVPICMLLTSYAPNDVAVTDPGADCAGPAQSQLSLPQGPIAGDVHTNVHFLGSHRLEFQDLLVRRR